MSLIKKKCHISILQITSSKIYRCQAKTWFSSWKVIFLLLFFYLFFFYFNCKYVKKQILTICACQKHSHIVLKLDSRMCWKWHICVFLKGVFTEVASRSAAVISLLRLFLPSQPQGGAVDLGALGPGLRRLALHPPSSVAFQALMDLRGHGEESPLHVIWALSARLQEGDLKRRGQILSEKKGTRDGGRNPERRGRETNYYSFIIQKYYLRVKY